MRRCSSDDADAPKGYAHAYISYACSRRREQTGDLIAACCQRFASASRCYCA
ncbi:hypothetical protein KCP73_19240 [Salmonella enterica subsp. enterica]|nr:hypothetical protein KCP73_19240 [Salmonella enterica subsp. enterica]